MAAAFEPTIEGSACWQRVYVDLPGCGRSPAGAESSDGVVDAVCDYVDAKLGSEPFLLSGCSYGGYLADAIARRRPDQVAGLLLVCPGIKILGEDRVLPEGPSIRAADDWLADVPQDLHDHLSRAVGNRTHEVGSRLGRVLSGSGPADEEYLQRLRTTGYQLSDEDSSTVYAGPTSVLAGREDRIVGYVDQFHAIDRYPDATYVALSAAGHYCPSNNPKPSGASRKSGSPAARVAPLSTEWRGSGSCAGQRRVYPGSAGWTRPTSVASGSGMGNPSSARPSKCRAMASATRRSVSVRVAPATPIPGRAGT